MVHNSAVTTPTALSNTSQNRSTQAMTGISTQTYYQEKMYFTQKKKKKKINP
jgi:hypothetical protein